MAEINLLARYPKSRRNLIERVRAKDENRMIARKFGREYFDGTRDQGYGGYRYDGRWLPVARDIVARYGLKSGDKVLDVGCAKGFLLRDLLAVVPGLEIWGLEISRYAIDNCDPAIAGRLVQGSADRLPFAAGVFSVALAINVIHNLERAGCCAALRELQRVSGGRCYVQVDAYRTEEERAIFVDWALTAETFGTPQMWAELFKEAAYNGDYYWTIIEADGEWLVRNDAGQQVQPH